MIKIKEIQTDKEFRDLQQEWETLEPKVADITVFQTWVFQYHCWKIFENTVTPLVLIFQDEKDQLLAILPLGSRIEKTGPFSFSILGFASVKYCDFQNIVCHQDYVPPVMAVFSEWLQANRRRWDHIELSLIREDFTLWQHRDVLAKNVHDRITIDEQGVAPFVCIQPDWDDFQNALSGKRAKAVRYEIRNLFRQFDGEFKRHEKGEALGSSLERFMDLHQKRIRQKYQLGAFPTREIREGFTRLVRALENYGYIDIHTIESAEQTIAAIGTFIHNGVVSYFQGGFDPGYQRVSPGKVVLALRITTAVQDKQKEFDFLFGDEDYKFSWSTGRRRIYRLQIATGSRKQKLYTLIQQLLTRMQQSDRLRALYFRLSGK